MAKSQQAGRSGRTRAVLASFSKSPAEQHQTEGKELPSFHPPCSQTVQLLRSCMMCRESMTEYLHLVSATPNL